jgi:hypothetical protein
MKARPSKTKPKHCREPAAARRRGPSAADLQKQLDRHTRELTEAREHLAEALEQQAATSEVLKVISGSPGKLKPVFDAMLANAIRLCDAKFGNINLSEGDALRVIALQGAPPSYAEERQRNPVIRPRPETMLGRALATKQAVQIADIRDEADYDDPVPGATGAKLAPCSPCRCSEKPSWSARF